jgi:hypothetical protein
MRSSLSLSDIIEQFDFLSCIGESVDIDFEDELELF